MGSQGTTPSCQCCGPPFCQVLPCPHASPELAQPLIVPAATFCAVQYCVWLPSSSRMLGCKRGEQGWAYALGGTAFQSSGAPACATLPSNTMLLVAIPHMSLAQPYHAPWTSWCHLQPRVPVPAAGASWLGCSHSWCSCTLGCTACCSGGFFTICRSKRAELPCKSRWHVCDDGVQQP
jgi:hypothetical protein